MMLKSPTLLTTKKNHPIQTMCDVLDVPRSTYYQSLNKTISNRERENNKLTKRIIEIHNDSDKRYGAPKIHHLLNEEGYLVSLKRVQRLMKKENIRSITVKRFRPTPSKEKIVERENILDRDFSTKTINEKNGLAILRIFTRYDMAGTILPPLLWIYILRKLLVIPFLAQ